ncbi:MAG TPA: transposase [Verrucomicrobiae bacterium]|jgi:putative transposase
MNDPLPPVPSNFSLAPGASKNLASEAVPKDWPHAPVHRLSEHGVYFITAGTLRKQHVFDNAPKRDLLERMLLSLSNAYGWQLEAWAVFSNHYHFVARGSPDSAPMRQLLTKLHSRSAIEANRADATEGRTVWHNFWDTRLTYQYSYLTRLNYVHQNPVKHGLVAVANQYPWCSAAWFERTASPAQIKTIYNLKIDNIKLDDDF